MIPRTNKTPVATRAFHAPAATYAAGGRQPHKQEPVEIAGEHLRYDWTAKDKETVKQMWREGKSGKEIREAVGRYWLEVVILVDGYIKGGQLKERPWGGVRVGKN